AVDAGRGDGERGLDAEAGRDLADADLAGDAGGRRQRDLLLAGHELQRAQEAGRVAGGEQLFGIGAWAAGAAQLARRGQLHVEDAVVGAGAAVTAPGGGSGGGVEDLLDGHGVTPVGGWAGLRAPVRRTLRRTPGPLVM